MKGLMQSPLLKKLTKGKKGFSLMEIVLVLTIIGAATMVVISAFNNSGSSQDAQAETQNVSSLSASIKHMFKTQGNYKGLSNTVILTDVSFPEQMREPTGNLIKSAWYSDGYDVQSENVDGTADDGYSIVMKGVPQGACTAIVSATYRHFVEVLAGSTTIDGVASAASACTDGVDLTFINR